MNTVDRSNPPRLKPPRPKIRALRGINNYTQSFGVEFPIMTKVPLFDATRAPLLTLGDSGSPFEGASVADDPELAPNLTCGERIPDELLNRFPAVLHAHKTNALSRTKRGITQDMLFFGLLVSSKCRTAIEFLEPNRHQFIPVTIIGLDGVANDFFYFNCLNWVAADDLYCFSNISTVPGVQQSETGIYNPVPGLKFWSIGTASRPPVCAVNFDDCEIVIEGARAWNARPKARGPGRYLCQQRFFKKAQELGLKGISFTKLFDVNDAD